MLTRACQRYAHARCHKEIELDDGTCEICSCDCHVAKWMPSTAEPSIAATESPAVAPDPLKPQYRIVSSFKMADGDDTGLSPAPSELQGLQPPPLTGPIDRFRFNLACDQRPDDSAPWELTTCVGGLCSGTGQTPLMWRRQGSRADVCETCQILLADELFQLKRAQAIRTGGYQPVDPFR
jgi:hypothetical protein